jgi:hypothetical protein
VTRIGAYPGSFNPPTTAHLAIADAARRQRRLDRVDLVISRVTLAKEHVELPLLEHRVGVLERIGRRLPWLGVRITEAQLLADIAEGYDVVVMGADKWTQVNDVSWYGDEAARARALARLPEPVVVPRPPHEVPERYRLDVDDALATVSSTAARAGAAELMVPEALAFARRTGAWIDDQRYRAHLGR